MMKWLIHSEKAKSTMEVAGKHIHRELPQIYTFKVYFEAAMFNSLMNSSELDALNLSKCMYYALKHRNELTDAVLRCHYE